MHFTFARIGETERKPNKPSVPLWKVDIRPRKGALVTHTYEGTDPQIMVPIEKYLASAFRSKGAERLAPVAAGHSAAEFQTSLNDIVRELKDKTELCYTRKKYSVRS